MNVVFSETKKLILPIVFLDSILITFLFITNQSNIVDIIAIILASAYSLVNFFMIGSAIAVSVEKTVKKAQGYMVSQYFVRYVITGMIIYYSVIIPEINVFTIVLPLFFPKIILVYRSFLNRK